MALSEIFGTIILFGVSYPVYKLVSRMLSFIVITESWFKFWIFLCARSALEGLISGLGFFVGMQLRAKSILTSYAKSF